MGEYDLWLIFNEVPIYFKCSNFHQLFELSKYLLNLDSLINVLNRNNML